MNNIERNDPCWCGSGKKYKKCHLNVDEVKVKSVEKVVPKNPLVLSESDRHKMRKAGKFNAQLMDYLRDKIVVGVTTNQIDKLVYDYTISHKHIPACLGYHGFPKSLCTSVNDVVCHGIPSDYALRDGDIVNIDLTSIVDGWHGDQSEMFLVGDVSKEAKRLCEVAYEAMMVGIQAIKPGEPVGLVGKEIQIYVEPKGFSVVRSYQGHGIGKQFHQDPPVPHFKTWEAMRHIALPGMCFTVEPMVNVGTYQTVLDKHDGWTVRTKDGSLSAQWEHTILVTESGVEILTQCEGKPSIYK